jgi:hypothetical protein
MKQVRRLLKPKMVMSVLAVGGVLALAGWFYQYNQSPVVGTVSRPTADMHTQGVTSTRLRSASMAFEHPVHYTVENKAVVTPIVEQYMLNMQGAEESRRISITIRKAAPGETVYDDSAYKFRVLKTSGYKVSDATVDGQTSKKMTKNDNTEITYFVPGPKYYAIVAATSTNPKEAFSNEITDVMKSFAWVK